MSYKHALQKRNQWIHGNWSQWYISVDSKDMLMRQVHMSGLLVSNHIFAISLVDEGSQSTQGRPQYSHKSLTNAVTSIVLYRVCSEKKL